MKLKIGHLYPDLLNLYGDRGNIMSLVKRLEWRGISAEAVTVLAGDTPDFSDLDIVVVGGGSDREQETACELLRPVKDDFKSYVEDGGAVLALCGGFPMLGGYYCTKDKKIEGLSVLDITSKWEAKRYIGNIRLDSPLSPHPVYGFENHNSRTYIGSYTPFGKVTHGHGNNGRGKEGLVYKNLIATNVHGPLLPKNPEVSDWLLMRALSKKYGGEAVLPPLDDGLETLANKEAAPLFTAKVILSRM